MNEMVSYEIIRSRRKTLAIEVTLSGSVTVRAPLRTTEREIQSFVNTRADWIEEHLEKMRLRREAQGTFAANNKETIEETVKRAMEIIPQRTSYYADLLGVSYGRITIRNQKTRWGSCSSRGNLNFHYALILMPPEILDYVVVHELCHRLEMNHSVKFWQLVENILPDYRQRRLWLKEHGTEYRQ